MGLWQSDEPVTNLVQSRTVAIGGVLLSLAALAAGMLLPRYHYYLGEFVPTEWVLLTIGAFGLLWTLAMVFKPNRLIISDAGLEFHWFLSVRRFPWTVVQEIGLSGTGPNPGVRLELAWGDTLNLPGGWPIDSEAVAALIERARRQNLQGNRASRPATMSKIKSAHGALF